MHGEYGVFRNENYVQANITPICVGNTGSVVKFFKHCGITPPYAWGIRSGGKSLFSKPKDHPHMHGEYLKILIMTTFSLLKSPSFI